MAADFKATDRVDGNLSRLVTLYEKRHNHILWFFSQKFDGTHYRILESDSVTAQPVDFLDNVTPKQEAAAGSSSEI